MRSFSCCVIGSLEAGDEEWALAATSPGEGEAGGGGGGCRGEERRVNSCRDNQRCG